MVTPFIQRTWMRGHEQIRKTTRKLYQGNATLSELLWLGIDFYLKFIIYFKHTNGKLISVKRFVLSVSAACLTDLFFCTSMTV